MVCINFVPYISSILVGKTYRKKYCLSCCEVRYGFGMEILPFLFKVLGEFSSAKIYKKKFHSLTYSSMVIEIPTKAKYHVTF